MQAKVNRELRKVGANLTCTDMSEGCITWHNSKIDSEIYGAEENNVLPLQTITSDDYEEALAGAPTTLNLLSPPPDNSASENLSQRSVKMKCYYHLKHCYFLDYFTSPIPDDAVICTSDIPFQYSKREGRYTGFISHPKRRVFVAAKRDS